MSPHAVSVGAALLALASALSSQCQLSQCHNPWLPNAGWAGVNRDVADVAHWDPDGPGPAPEQLVAVGEFWAAGKIAADGIAMWDPASSSWSTFPPLPFTPERALVLPSGELWVTAQLDPTNPIDFARWNGTAWQPEQVTLQSVRAFTTLPNGDLVIGGGGGVRRWNGSYWASLGWLPGSVHALETLPNGDIVAGGDFTAAGGAPANGLIVWNGSTWSGLGLGLNGSVSSLLRRANGDLVAAGSFTLAGGQIAKRVAVWDGTTWSPMGAGMNNSVTTLAGLPGGDILAGGRFTLAGSVTANRIARWDGVAWQQVAAGGSGGANEGIGNTTNDLVNALSVAANGHVVAGGRFRRAGTIGVSDVATWTGSAWTAMGTGGSGTVFEIDVLPNGDVVACGTCTVLAGETVNHIARFDGTSWSPLGVLSAADGLPYAMTAQPNGDVIVAGVFESIGGTAANHIARWDGSTWSPLGAGVDSLSGNAQIVTAMTTMANGDLVVAGSLSSAGGAPANGLARWNGSTWSALGSGITGPVYALAAMPNGELIAAGSFTAPAGGVARWDGSTWSSLGGGVYAPGFGATVWSLQLLPNGDLVAGGSFTTAGGQPANNIARWDGATWQPLGGGIGSSTSDVVFAMTVLGDGDLAVSGQFLTAGSVPCERLARWNGSSWAALGSGLPRGATSMATLPDGDLAISAANLSGQVWRLTTTCPASATVGGPGCPSSGGNNSLNATSLPWLGSTFVAAGEGLPSPAFVFAVSGVTRFAPGQLPLASLFAAGKPGCDLLVSPDWVAATWTTAGAITTEVSVPADSALVGASFDHQLIAFEVDAQLTITSATASNTLQLVIGLF